VEVGILKGYSLLLVYQRGNQIAVLGAPPDPSLEIRDWFNPRGFIRCPYTNTNVLNAAEKQRSFKKI